MTKNQPQDAPVFNSKPGLAPCHTCGDDLQVLKGKAAEYVLPVGVRPDSIHSEFYDNLVEGPHELPLDDAYICVCGVEKPHIHCIQCISKIIKEKTSLGEDVPKAAPKTPVSECIQWEALITVIRESIKVQVDSKPGQPPCICSDIATSTILAKKSSKNLVSFLEKDYTGPKNCPHKEESMQQHQGNPDILPRSIANGFIYDLSEGRKMGSIYEQQIGATVVCRMHDTSTTIRGQDNHVHLWLSKNYTSKTGKGYEESVQGHLARPKTPRAVFHNSFGEDSICHGIYYGQNDPWQYSCCRVIEGGSLVWISDIGVLDGACCGKCQTDVLILLLSTSIESADRIRDRMTGDTFKIHNVIGRQRELSLAMWEGIAIRGAEDFCCERSKTIHRTVKNMMCWMFANPVYYAHSWGQAEGVMGYSEALNGFMMTHVKRSQSGGEDDRAKVDDIINRMISTRLLDFLVYFCS
ncbi:hypothetical protein TWF481_008699 [Arthrobotrys musiformis]|uniref:Uncharacterized protein n=1 Tax=Arthrobotrys musiformis TaxID=47236 RepID=A0AAV9WAC3_9PEZI